MAPDRTPPEDAPKRPLHERLTEIARDAQRLANPARARAVDKDEIDGLWGNLNAGSDAPAAKPD